MKVILLMFGQYKKRLLKMNKKGFTLLELLMVIIVVGILTSFAIPQYQSFVYKAHVAEAHRLLGALIRAEEQFFLEHGDYTKDMDELDVSVQSDEWFINIKETAFINPAIF